MFWLFVCIIALVAYLIGGLNGAIVASKYIYRKDVRKYGSGNPGLTNFYRVFGKGGIAIVLAIDILKTVVPGIFAGILLGRLGYAVLGRCISALFSMIGHAFPIYYGFKGGKAVLAGGTAVLVIDWRVALFAYAMFLLPILFTRYVSLGSMIAGVALPVGMVIFQVGGFWEIFVCALCGALLIYRHKANLVRIFKGTENKFSVKKKE